ncbi:dCTP deaminase, partial [Mycobacterium tuberculosis]|uniref:dCTP deaminase n=1 Tax=Mycobacterium tuberculosis TaxID=1773 RepID=UPI001F1B1225
MNTVEVVKIPDDLTGRVYERSSVKYLGLMISPAHYMNPGYRGSITLLMVNHSSAPIRLVPGIKICQLSLHGMSSASEKPYSKQDAKYMDSRGPSISKLHLDKDIQDFLS